MAPYTGPGYQAIILAGGDDKRMHPLTSASLKVLLPVVNRPLLTYPLRSLAAAGVRHVYIVVMGEEPTANIQAWINQQQEFSGPNATMLCEVFKAPKDCTGTADALRAVGPRVNARTLVVVAGDLLTDYPINTLVAKHQMDGALATALLFKRKASPASETQAGKPPKNVDCIGLDSTSSRLLFYASSTEALRDPRVPLAAVRAHGPMRLVTDLVDAHVYVFDRAVLSLLAERPTLSSVRQDLLPWLTQQPAAGASLGPRTDSGIVPDAVTLVQQAAADFSGGGAVEDDDGTGADYLSYTHSLAVHETPPAPTRAPAPAPRALHVSIVPPGVYCARIADAASYSEVNRDLADPRTALHLTPLKASPQYDNVVPASTTIGSKSMIAAACVLGEGCALGDKTSIKRSVLGAGCRLGSNVKILNSVLQDGVVVGDGATVQNSVLCAGAVVKERAALKDCQVGSGYTVAGGKEYTGETLGGKPVLAA